MYDKEIILELLHEVHDALNRIPARIKEINSPEDFKSSETGVEKFDAICMVLIAVGETVKKIDKKTEGALFGKYPGTNWKGIKGVRDVIAHGYFDVDEADIYAICKNDVPALIEQLEIIIKEIQ